MSPTRAGAATHTHEVCVALPVDALAGEVRAPLVVVTGKGGTGKSTVTAALARRLAATGSNTLVIDIQHRQGVARALGTPALDAAHRPIGHHLWAATIDRGATISEYLERFHALGRLPGFGAIVRSFDLLTAATPGLADLLLLAKVTDLVHDRGGPGQQRRYDIVIVDGPPIGQVAAMVTAPQRLTPLLQHGALLRRVELVTHLVTDPQRTAMVVVATPEDLAVEETVHGVAELGELGVAVRSVVANRVTPHAPVHEAMEDPAAGPADHAAAAVHQARTARQASAVAPLLPLVPGVARSTGMLPEVVPDVSSSPQQRSTGPSGAWLGDTLREARTILTCGSGGVGKTTVSAGLGIAAARAGRRVLVMTIDPAHRLAQALGGSELGATPRPVQDLPGGGHVSAMMVDVEATFATAVRRQAATAEQAEAILTNPIARALAGGLAGTADYAAVEQLHDLHATGDWDLIVVDTPPSRSSLDILDAPHRMASLFEHPLARMLAPGSGLTRGPGGILGRGRDSLLRLAGSVTGATVLEDVATFLRSLDGLAGGFAHRAVAVGAMLEDPATRFVIVTSPDPGPLADARWFQQRLARDGRRADGFIANRVAADLVESDQTMAGRAGSGPRAVLLDAPWPTSTTAEAIELEHRRTQLHRQSVADALGGDELWVVVEEFLGDLHSWDGLQALADALTAADC